MSVCRICLIEKTCFNASDIFKYNAKMEDYRTVLQQTFNIQNLKSKRSVVCDQCVMQIKNASKLKHLILKSDEYFANLNNCCEKDVKNVKNEDVSSSENENKAVPTSLETTQIKIEPDESIESVGVSSGNDGNDVPCSSSSDNNVPTLSETTDIKLEPEVKSENQMDSLIDIGEEVKYTPVINPAPPCILNSEETATTEQNKTVVTQYIIKPKNVLPIEFQSENEGYNHTIKKDNSNSPDENRDFQPYLEVREELIPCCISGKQMKKAAKYYRRKRPWSPKNKVGETNERGYEYAVVFEPTTKKNKN